MGDCVCMYAVWGIFIFRAAFVCLGGLHSKTRGGRAVSHPHGPDRRETADIIADIIYKERVHLKRILSLILALALCASLAAPALAAEAADPGPSSGAEIGGEMASSVDPGIAPSDAPETAPIDPAANDPNATTSDPEAQPETGEADPIDPGTTAETTDPSTETAETTPETTETEMPLVVTFSDVPASHTFYAGITYCASKGIVGGYPDGTFRPANTVTKNHFCAMLARAFYPDQVEKYSTDYYKNTFGTFGPTNMALALNGTLDDTSFRWQYTNASVMGTGINRYDMAQLMTNIMRAKGFTANSSQKNAAQTKITDYKNIPSQYQDAVKNVYALGVIGGYGDGRFVGTNIMNRGQAAIVIQRMAQYAPVKGDQDNDTYDDGTEKNPSTSTGNTGNTGSTSTGSNTGSNTGSTGNTGNTGTTTPKPEPKPETPAARTLSNGKAITESNVTAILTQLQAKYPRKTDFSKGYGGLGSGRSPWNNCIDKVIKNYNPCSTTAGCGGWAAFVADEIFGQTGVTWKKTTIANARPGDLMVILDDAGRLTHVGIYVHEVDGWAKTMKVYSTDANPSNGVYHISWANNTRPYTNDIDVYTAYPD